jgi:hypothetical protein
VLPLPVHQQLLIQRQTNVSQLRCGFVSIVAIFLASLIDEVVETKEL